MELPERPVIRVVDEHIFATLFTNAINIWPNIDEVELTSWT